MAVSFLLVLKIDVAVTVKVVFASSLAIVNKPLLVIVLVTVSVPVTSHDTVSGAIPVATTVAVNCTFCPYEAVAVFGDKVTLVTSGVSVVNAIAFANCEVESTCQWWKK